MKTVMDIWDNRVGQDLASERARKAAPAPRLAPGAKSESESKILISLRASPATSEAALANAIKLNELATMLALRALQDRGLVRRVTNTIGVTSIVATG